MLQHQLPSNLINKEGGFSRPPFYFPYEERERTNDHDAQVCNGLHQHGSRAQEAQAFLLEERGIEARQETSTHRRIHFRQHLKHAARRITIILFHMSAPDWVETKIQRLMRLNCRLSYYQAATIVGRRGGNKRHHKNGYKYGSPPPRPTPMMPVRLPSFVPPPKITQLSLGLQLQTPYY